MASSDLMILLQAPKCWNYSQVPPYLCSKLVLSLFSFLFNCRSAGQRPLQQTRKEATTV